MNTLTIGELDFGEIGLDDLCEDPEAGGLILPFTVGWGGRELDDRGLAYLGEAAELHNEEMRGYIVGEVVEVLGVPVERWLAVLARGKNQEEANRAMDVIKEQLRSEGRAEGQTEVFLRAAERRFQRVPEHLAAQARGASSDQIDAWLDSLYEASDLESVFNGSGNGDASG